MREQRSSGNDLTSFCPSVTTTCGIAVWHSRAPRALSRASSCPRGARQRAAVSFGCPPPAIVEVYLPRYQKEASSRLCHEIFFSSPVIFQLRMKVQGPTYSEFPLLERFSWAALKHPQPPAKPTVFLNNSTPQMLWKSQEIAGAVHGTASKLLCCSRAALCPRTPLSPRYWQHATEILSKVYK